MAVVPCPSCNESVRIPSFSSRSVAVMKCPWCGYEASPAEWEERLPPSAILLDAEGAPVAAESRVDHFDPPSDDDESKLWDEGPSLLIDGSPEQFDSEAESRESVQNDPSGADALVDRELLAQRFEHEGADLLDHPGELPAALDFEGELTELPDHRADEAQVNRSMPDSNSEFDELDELLLATAPENSTRPRVPLAEDQRSYYQRHPMPKRRWSPKMLLRVLGPILIAAPIVIAIAWHAGLFDHRSSKLVAGNDGESTDLDPSPGSGASTSEPLPPEDSPKLTDAGEQFTSTSDVDSNPDREADQGDQLFAVSSDSDEITSLLDDAAESSKEPARPSSPTDLDEVLESIKRNVEATPIEHDVSDSEQSPTPFELAMEYEASQNEGQPEAGETESYLMLPPKKDSIPAPSLQSDASTGDADGSSGRTDVDADLERNTDRGIASIKSDDTSDSELDSTPEELYSEPVTSEPVTSEPVTPEAMTSEAMTSEPVTPEAMTSDEASRSSGQPLSEVLSAPAPSAPIVQAGGQTESVPLGSDEETADLLVPAEEDLGQDPTTMEDENPLPQPPLRSEPAVVESVETDSKVEAACESASKTLEKLQGVTDTDAHRLKLEAYRDLAALGTLELSGSSEGVDSVLRSLNAETRSSLAALCEPWITWSRRPTDGLLLIGRFKDEAGELRFEVEGGERYRVEIPSELDHLVSAETVVGVGRLLHGGETSDDASSLRSVRLTAGVLVPL